MPGWLNEISAFTIFLGIGAFGFLFLLLSLVAGELFDMFDSSLDHDHDAGGPSILSSRVLSVFITAFGGFGALASHSGYGIAVSSGAGVASGFVFGGIIYYFAKFLHGQQATTEVRTTDLENRSGRIIVAVPLNGLGQIRVQIGEEIVDKIARSHDGKAIPENTLVKIEQVFGDMVVVRRQ